MLIQTKNGRTEALPQPKNYLCSFLKETRIIAQKSVTLIPCYLGDHKVTDASRETGRAELWIFIPCYTKIGKQSLR